MNFIKKHLTAIIVTLVCLVLLALASVAVYHIFYPSTDKSINGDRGAGAPLVTDTDFATVIEEINETELVNKVTYNISSSNTTIKFFIDVKSDAKIKSVKKIGDIILEGFNADVIDFYDISINVTQSEGEMVDYPAIGQKAKNSKVFNWVLNKEVSDSEE